MNFARFVVMTSVPTSRPVPIEDPSAPKTSNHVATVALVVAIVGLVVTQIPFFAGIIVGGPEDIAGLVLGIIGIATAFRRGSGRTKAIVATVIAAVTVVAIPFGEGWLW
jgi:hypothetical protein